MEGAAGERGASMAAKKPLLRTPFPFSFPFPSFFIRSGGLRRLVEGPFIGRPSSSPSFASGATAFAPRFSTGLLSRCFLTLSFARRAVARGQGKPFLPLSLSGKTLSTLPPLWELRCDGIEEKGEAVPQRLMESPTPEPWLAARWSKGGSASPRESMTPRGSSSRCARYSSALMRRL
jgi:hypothetical protein